MTQEDSGNLQDWQSRDDV